MVSRIFSIGLTQIDKKIVYDKTQSAKQHFYTLKSSSLFQHHQKQERKTFFQGPRDFHYQFFQFVQSSFDRICKASERVKIKNANQWFSYQKTVIKNVDANRPFRSKNVFDAMRGPNLRNILNVFWETKSPVRIF